MGDILQSASPPPSRPTRTRTQTHAPTRSVPCDLPITILIIYSWSILNTQHAVCWDGGSLTLPNTQSTDTSKQTKKTSYSASYLENLNGIYRKKRQTPCRGNWTRFARLQSHNCKELNEGKIFLNYKCNNIGIAVKEPRTEQKIPHKSPSTYYGFLFWHFKEGYITARVFFLFLFFFFVIFNVRFELSELEMTCRVKLEIIMPSLVKVQNAALSRFSTDRQYPVLLYIPCKFWL